MLYEPREHNHRECCAYKELWIIVIAAIFRPGPRHASLRPEISDLHKICKLASPDADILSAPATSIQNPDPLILINIKDDETSKYIIYIFKIKSYV